MIGTMGSCSRKNPDDEPETPIYEQNGYEPPPPVTEQNGYEAPTPVSEQNGYGQEDSPTTQPDEIEQPTEIPQNASNYETNDEKSHLQLIAEKQKEQTENTITTTITVADVFVEMEESLSITEIEENFNVIHFGTSSPWMGSTYQSTFATSEYLIIVNIEFEGVVGAEDRTIVRSWLDINQSNAFKITAEELMASKFQFFMHIGESPMGFFPGATVDDFYNDPVIQKIMEYPENLIIERVSEFNGRYVLKKDGIEVTGGLLKPGMTFERVEQTRVMSNGRILRDDDYVVLTLIEFIEFNY